MKTIEQITYQAHMFRRVQLEKEQLRRRKRKKEELYHFLKFYKEQRRLHQRRDHQFNTLVPIVYKPLVSECAICLEKNGESHRQINQCKHGFHSQCIEYWVKRGNWNCPLCRTPITPSV